MENVYVSTESKYYNLKREREIESLRYAIETQIVAIRRGRDRVSPSESDIRDVESRRQKVQIVLIQEGGAGQRQRPEKPLQDSGLGAVHRLQVADQILYATLTDDAENAAGEILL